MGGSRPCNAGFGMNEDRAATACAFGDARHRAWRRRAASGPRKLHPRTVRVVVCHPASRAGRLLAAHLNEVNAGSSRGTRHRAEFRFSSVAGLQHQGFAGGAVGKRCVVGRADRTAEGAHGSLHHRWWDPRSGAQQPRWSAAVQAIRGRTAGRDSGQRPVSTGRAASGVRPGSVRSRSRRLAGRSGDRSPGSCARPRPGTVCGGACLGEGRPHAGQLDFGTLSQTSTRRLIARPCSFSLQAVGAIGP